MVSFPANSAFSDRLDADADAVRLDSILPDVLRRYGLELGSEPPASVRATPSPSLPLLTWLPIADNHSMGMR